MRRWHPTTRKVKVVWNISGIFRLEPANLIHNLAVNRQRHPALYPYFQGAKGQSPWPARMGDVPTYALWNGRPPDHFMRMYWCAATVLSGVRFRSFFFSIFPNALSFLEQRAKPLLSQTRSP